MTLVQAPQPPTPIVPAVVAAQNIKSRLTDFWAEAVATYRQCYNQFWFDPNGAAPRRRRRATWHGCGESPSSEFGPLCDYCAGRRLSSGCAGDGSDGVDVGG